MRNLILLAFAIILYNNQATHAQDFTQTVKGKITDGETQVPLPGAYIILIGSDPVMGAISDANGNYTFPDIPIGRKSFKVTYIGYEDVLFHDINITTGQEVVLNVKMLEAINKMDEYYHAESGTINEVYMTGLIPVLNYKVQF